MIGSNGNSGSFGKYICVTSRDWNDVPNSEKWMCAGRQAFVVIPPRICPGLDGGELVMTLRVGHHPSAA